MKKKSFNKKLVLNKNVISSLENSQMEKIKGGSVLYNCGSVVDYTCSGPCADTSDCPVERERIG